MIYPFKYRGWLVCANMTDWNDEYTGQKGLLPWGMHYTSSAKDSAESFQNKKINVNMKALPDAINKSKYLIGTKEISVILNIPVRQIQRLAKRNKLPPPVPHNKNLLWVKEELLKWLRDKNIRKVIIE